MHPTETRERALALLLLFPKSSGHQTPPAMRASNGGLWWKRGGTDVRPRTLARPVLKCATRAYSDPNQMIIGTSATALGT